jgi:hypothetical protein
MRVPPLATLLCSLAAAAAYVAGPMASPALAASCELQNTPIFDGGGYRYDFDGQSTTFSGINDGGSNGPADVPPGPAGAGDAWDEWGNIFVYPPGADPANPALEDTYDGPEDGCSFALGGQEVAYPPASLHGLEVQHRWYVDPGPLVGARSLIVLRNASAAPIPVTVALGDASGFGNLGSDQATMARATSDGSGIFSAASRWGVSSDQSGGDPVLAHVWDGPSGALRVSEAVLSSPISRDVLYWDWNVTVPAGATVALISYAIQAVEPSGDTTAEIAQAVAQADARQKQAPVSLYIGMSPAEIAGTLNWPHPAPAAAVAPVEKANAAQPVLLDGRASLAATGLPQCAVSGYAWQTDDGGKGTGATLPHFFAPGRHEATLTVTSNCGGTATAKASFTVANGLRLGKVKLNRKTGTGRLTVKALGAGKLSLRGKGIKKQAKQLKKAGRAVLTLKPTGKALKALRRRGKAKVKVTVALLPAGGKASKLSKTAVLRSVVK